MSNLNYIFFEEYKHLDKLCSELYQEQHGISHYICDMKSTPSNAYQHIPGWKEDLEKLIRLRHIRNYLAHTANAFDEEVCTHEDIEWSHEFRRRILKQSDPMSLLHQYSVEKPSTSKPQSLRASMQSHTSITEIKKIRSYTNKESHLLYWIKSLLIIIWIVLLVVLGITVMWVFCY